MQFGKKTTWQTIVYSWPVALVLCVVVVVFSITVYERFQAEREMAQRRAAVEERHSALEDRRAVLEDKVEYLQAERGIEEELRRNFDVAKPGEQVVVLTGDVKEVATTSYNVESPRPWWQFWY